MRDNHSMQIGDSVIIRRGDTYKHVKIMKGKTQRVGSGLHVPLGQLIGHPFGSSFQVDRGKLTRVKPSLLENSGEEMLKHTEDGDNREIVDDCQSQKLDRDDITTMKEQGESGEKIVEKLVQNSSTFQERSIFSKAKYLRKKSQKHIPHFVAEYPTARVICQLLANEQYPKSMGLQVHTLGQMLAWANVRSGTKVLVFESTQSFITGAVMERLGSEGHVVQLYPGAYPVRTLLDDFNYGDDLKERVLHGYSLEKVIYLEQPESSESFCNWMQAHTCKSGRTEESNSKDVDNVQNAMDCSTTNVLPEIKLEDGRISTKEKGSSDTLLLSQSESSNVLQYTSQIEAQNQEQNNKGQKRKSDMKSGNTDDEIPPKLKRQREERAREESKAIELLKERNFDSLIIASRYNPKDSLLTLLKFLPPSRPFVVYCQYKEPLMECYVHLRNLQVAVNVVLSTTWFRKIQSLPGRTHPQVKSPGKGGYLLHGMTVEAPPMTSKDEPLKGTF